jgi:hypothetical protein
VPRRPPLSRRAAVAAALLLLATGCTSSDEPAPQATGPVEVPAPSVDAAGRASCAALAAALPVEVDPGVERRPVSGDEQLTAAWGDPPVTLECGVPDPDRLPEPVTVNGVVWSVRDIGAGHRWTTRDLTLNVAVEIPDAYDNGAEIVNPLAEPILAALEPADG